MAIEIKAPTYPESVQEGTLAAWHKQPGDSVARDELIVDIETDKVVLEVVASASGTLTKLLKAEGDIVLSNEVLAHIEEGEAAVSPATVLAVPEPDHQVGGALVNPAAKKLADERDIDLSQVSGTGKGGRITKEDVVNFSPAVVSVAAVIVPAASKESAALEPLLQDGERVERRVPMTRMRSTIAKRLVSAQNDAAMLTTYNEVDMSPIMALRKQYKAQFEKAHNGTRLGFMSFFVKAAAEALKRFPAVNASLDGNDMVYHAYQDISVAVSTERGLVVPVLRDVEAMSLADIEKGIVGLATQAKEGKLTMEEMQGGTFTITNGGIFGSLLSTPILNPPQTAILGMHTIQDRPVAENGQVVIRPMMYLALSYDHRMIDGKEAVQFLVTIKELLQDPARILLEI